MYNVVQTIETRQISVWFNVNHLLMHEYAFQKYANKLKVFAKVVLPSFIHCFNKTHTPNIAKSIKRKSLLLCLYFCKLFTWEKVFNLLPI